MHRQGKNYLTPVNGWPRSFHSNDLTSYLPTGKVRISHFGPMLDITQREDIFKRLSLLNKDALPLFGRMSPRHMVEHLSFLVMVSDNKLPLILYYEQAKADKIKAHTIYSDKEIIIGFRAPMLTAEPSPLRKASLEEAIEELRVELNDFDLYFAENPAAMPVNPTMGPLSFNEWIIFHNKHFTHHFKQFNLA